MADAKTTHIVSLAYKPDFDEAKRYWRAYWCGEIIDRPLVCVRAFKDPANPPQWPRSVNGLGNTEVALAEWHEWASQVAWLGEAVPFLNPNFGPDMFAAWLGGRLEHSSVSSEPTTWAVPVVEDWDSHDLEHPRGIWWEQMLDFMQKAVISTDGKAIVGVPDLHSNMDALVALRGVERLCLDLVEIPEKIDDAMLRVRRAYRPIFEALESVGEMPERGYIGWVPFYCEERFACIQCDFICMISPEHFRRWVLPALEEEASYLEHCVYHLDGPGALIHLEDILSIPQIDVIQWVPGAGNPPQIEWRELLLKIQNAGKGLHIMCSVEEVKDFHRFLRPEGVLYDVWASSIQEGEELLKWLKANT
jgi:hypothetical protein